MKELIITGTGCTIKGECDDGIAFHSACLRNIKILLDGEDITDKVGTLKDVDGYMYSIIVDEVDDADLFMSEDNIELPPAVYELPDDAVPQKINLIESVRDLEEWEFYATWIDHIVYDGEDLEAKSYADNKHNFTDKMSPAFPTRLYIL